jgi:hypothetical protein
MFYALPASTLSEKSLWDRRDRDRQLEQAERAAGENALDERCGVLARGRGQRRADGIRRLPSMD